jgi:ATP phosphoribosyltransferase regulatory subunit HisZ
MSTNPVTPATPLTQISTDTAALIGVLKSSAAQLTADAKSDLAAALAAAHQEIVDLKGSGASVWSALLAAIGATPAPVPAPASAKR